MGQLTEKLLTWVILITKIKRLTRVRLLIEGSKIVGYIEKSDLSPSIFEGKLK